MISIVTPSFRQLDWMRLAVASVADQRGVAVEHIIQDAGTPGIEHFLEHFPAQRRATGSLQVYVEKDNGMYDAVNRGLKKAQGDIFAYLNCDEQYMPGALDRVAGYFRANPSVEIMFADTLVTDGTGKALSYRRVVRPTANHIRLSHLNTSTCATFFKRRIFEEGHRFDTKWTQIGDAVWVYELLKSGIRIGVYPHLLSIFTLTGQNMSIQNDMSGKEKELWSSQTDAPSPQLRTREVARHRLRKLFAGAYLKRSVNYEIYTLESPTSRTRFTAKGIGGRWKSG